MHEELTLANALRACQGWDAACSDRGAGRATIPSPPEESPLTIDGAPQDLPPPLLDRFASFTRLAPAPPDWFSGRTIRLKAGSSRSRRSVFYLTPERAAELARALQELSERGLSHPSIAAPIGAGVEDGVAWFAQAYVPAESLDSALRQVRPSACRRCAGHRDAPRGRARFRGRCRGRTRLAASTRRARRARGDTSRRYRRRRRARELRRTRARAPAIQRAGSSRGPAHFTRRRHLRPRGDCVRVAGRARIVVGLHDELVVADPDPVHGAVREGHQRLDVLGGRPEQVTGCRYRSR